MTTRSDTFKAIKSGQLKNYMIHDEDRVAIMVTQVTRGLGHHYSCCMLPVILAKMCVVKLIMQDAHEVDHQAEEVTIAVMDRMLHNWCKEPGHIHWEAVYQVSCPRRRDKNK